MSQPDFSDYLNGICKGIRSKAKRDDVMEELLCHLEANYERNLAIGMSEDEAKKDAIDKMGDSETLSYRLTAVHSYSPLKAMNSAFISLIAANFAINFFLKGTINEILFFCGLPIMFSALLRMRKMNRGIEAAFHFFNLFALSRLFFYCIGLGRVMPFWVHAVGYVISYGAQGLFWLKLYKGLHDFCQPYLTPESKKPHLIFCGAYQMLSSFFTAFILILAEGEAENIPSFIVPFFIVFMFFFTAVQLYRVRKILWDADGEYGILPDDSGHLKIWLGVIAACFVTVLSFNYLSSVRKPVKTELVIHDVSHEEQTEADKIRQKMLSWEVDEAIVNDLPDSEILNYKDAEFVTFGADGGSMGGSRSVRGADSIVWYYWFYIPIEEHPEHYNVRLLCYIESRYSDEIKHFYRKGFYFAPWTNIMPLNFKEENNGAYIGIITDERGKKYKAEPFFFHNLDDDNIQTWPKGFEYREEKGQRVYFAINLGMNSMYERANITAMTLRKRWICSFNYNTTADFAETCIEYGKVTTRDGKYMPYYCRTHGVIGGEPKEPPTETE